LRRRSWSWTDINGTHFWTLGRKSMRKFSWLSLWFSSLSCPSRDFGGIFAELLPGNFAKLQPPDGQDLMDGLEVKVQLGTVWKQSLTELSGGQR
jgi:hypothetical protein